MDRSSDEREATRECDGAALSLPKREEAAPSQTHDAAPSHSYNYEKAAAPGNFSVLVALARAARRAPPGAPKAPRSGENCGAQRRHAARSAAEGGKL